MSEERPTRVRVTGPPRRRASVVRTAGSREIDAGTEVGAVYKRSVLREQRRLAVRVLLVLTISVGGLPLLFRAWPGLADERLLGVPIAWILLGVMVYPWLVFLGWSFMRQAEQNESDFEALVGEEQQ